MFRIFNTILFFLIVFPTASCARSLPVERRDYILSKPHGWINLTIVDIAIPNVKVTEDDKSLLKKPSYCIVSAKINGENFFALDVFPDGNEAPYRVDSGFRFPIPVGDQDITISYSGCRVDEKYESKGLESSSMIKIDENIDYEFIFEQDSFVFAQKRQSEEVTLKQIFDLLKKN